MLRLQSPMVFAAIGTIIAMWGTSSSLHSAPPEPRLEKELPLPAMRPDQFVGSAGWVGFDQTGRHVATAYYLIDDPRLAVWETAGWKVVRDMELIRMNRDREFGLRAAFHPAGSHVLTFDHLALNGWPLGRATTTLLTRAVDRGGVGTLSGRKGTYFVGERAIKHVSVHSDNTLYVDSVDPDKMKAFAEEKKVALEGSPALLTMEPGQSRIAWAQRVRKADDLDTPDVVRILDLSSGKSRKLESAQPIEPVACLAFSPDGKRLVSGSRDGFVRLWDVADGKERYCVSLNPFPIGSAAFAPDGRLIAFGGQHGGKDANLFLVEAATGKAAWVGSVDQRGVVSVGFSPNGDKLAVLGGTKGVSIYDVKDIRKSVGKD